MSKKHPIQAPCTFSGTGQTRETRETRCVLDVWRYWRLFTRLHTSNRWLKGQESLQKIPRRRCDSSSTVDDVIIRERARIKNVFGSRWSVHLVKCSKLEYFLRGFPPRKCTTGVVVINTSPKPDFYMATIRPKPSRRRPEGRNTAMKPSRNAIFERMLDRRIFKSSRANLQDNSTRHRKLTDHLKFPSDWCHQQHRSCRRLTCVCWLWLRSLSLGCPGLPSGSPQGSAPLPGWW